MSELKSIDNQSNTIENKGKIPKSVPYVVANIFFERYCTAGVLGEKFSEIFIETILNFQNF